MRAVGDQSGLILKKHNMAMHPSQVALAPPSLLGREEVYRNGSTVLMISHADEGACSLFFSSEA